MSHTPAPWTVEVSENLTTIESKYWTVAVDVSNADAPLIAAAPELLAALRGLLEMCERGPDLGQSGPDPEEMLDARVAIAKAVRP